MVAQGSVTGDRPNSKPAPEPTAQGVDEGRLAGPGRAAHSDFERPRHPGRGRRGRGRVPERRVGAPEVMSLGQDGDHALDLVGNGESRAGGEQEAAPIRAGRHVLQHDGRAQPLRHLRGGARHREPSGGGLFGNQPGRLLDAAAHLAQRLRVGRRRGIRRRGTSERVGSAAMGRAAVQREVAEGFPHRAPVRSAVGAPDERSGGHGRRGGRWLLLGHGPSLYTIIEGVPRRGGVTLTRRRGWVGCALATT